MTTGATGLDLALLQRGFQGELIEPTDAGFDSARRVWNAMIDRRPALIARCTTVGDVSAAIRFARETDLEIGVRCGGHSVTGQAVPDAGVMIDLTDGGPSSKVARCWATSTVPHRSMGSRRRPAMCHIPASVASPSAAGWDGWPGSSA